MMANEVSYGASVDALRKLPAEGQKMPNFEFTRARIVQHTIGIGADVRPPIELALDTLRIQQFYNDISERFPNLFADLNQSKTEFQIKKSIPIPGKGQISVPTFTLTQRGPVFNFPLTLAGILEDFSWSDTLNADVINCLDTLHRHLPGTHVHRIGKVRTLVFQCDDADGPEMFRDRFCPNAPDGAEELKVAWNDRDSSYNKRIAAELVEKKQVVQTDEGGLVQRELVPQGEHGVEVKFDVNNRRLDKPLAADDMMIILDHADELYASYLLRVLTGGEK